VPGFPPLPGFNAPDPDDSGAQGNGSGYGRPSRHDDQSSAPTHHKPTRHRPSQHQPAKSEQPAAWNDRPACPDRRPARSDHRTIQIDRSRDRSAHRRRSTVTERPPNIRAAHAYVNGAGYNTRRSIPEARNPDSRGDDNQNRSYRGNHRAGGQHHLDHQTPAQQRSSRVGRHHADPYDDYASR
jgi:hypothetical protein